MDDLLLVTAGDLGIRDGGEREQGVSLPASLTPYTLDGETDHIREVFKVSLIMAVKNQTTFFATGAFDHVELKAVDRFII